jgi:hypothetical protein
MPHALNFVAVGIVNESTLVAHDQARAIVEACNLQVRDHIAPAWDRKAIPVRYYSAEGKVPDDVALGVLLDNADQAGALGYHDETPAGRPYFRVFAKPSVDSGSGILEGAYAVSATASHEVAELFGDASCQQWVDNGAGVEYALELGDPVEADSYAVDTRAGPVLVSNFVLPAWFDPQASHSAVFDYLHRTSRPFQMTAGGYVLTRSAGQVTSSFGELVPGWRVEAKLVSPVARTARRIRQGDPDRPARLERGRR